jgi:hypothetical protein
MDYNFDREATIDPYIDKCFLILEKIERVKMKTNVLGLNIKLNQSFNNIYGHVKRSLESQLSKIGSVVIRIQNSD